MIRKIVQEDLTKFNTVVSFTVPEESYLLSTAAIHDKPVLYFVQPAVPEKNEEGNVLTTKVSIIAIHGNERWSDVVGNDLLSYIGVAIWDSGYRTVHVFEIVEVEEEFNEEDFKQLIEDLKEETPETLEVAEALEVEADISKDIEPKIEIEEEGEVKDGILTYTKE